MRDGMTKVVIDYAMMFTNAKGRMPRDVFELREWLREFAKYETDRADLTMKAYEDFVATVPMPSVVIVGEQPKCKCYTTKVNDYGAIMSGCDLDWTVTEDCPIHRKKNYTTFIMGKDDFKVGG
jgi:hypothetical protein